MFREDGPEEFYLERNIRDLKERAKVNREKSELATSEDRKRHFREEASNDDAAVKRNEARLEQVKRKLGI